MPHFEKICGLVNRQARRAAGKTPQENSRAKAERIDRLVAKMRERRNV